MKIIKKILKWTGILLLSLLLILAITVSMRQNLKYEAPYPEVHASKDSAVIARGEYIFYGPGHCLYCHASKKDYPPGTDLNDMLPSGGYEFDLSIAKIYTPNITNDHETGIGKLSDGAIARTLRYGIGSDGRALFDFMPFHNMADNDLEAIVSYLRTIPPVKNKVPENYFNIGGMIVKAFLIKPVGPDENPQKKVVPGVNVEYGKYLANSVANCRGCHTNRDMMTGAFIGPDYAGGLRLDAPGNPNAYCVSRNLTPDKETGHIYNWSEQQFINRFRAGKLIQESEMPWEAFKQFSEDDLKAIFMYLQTVKPIKNETGPSLVVTSKE